MYVVRMEVYQYDLFLFESLRFVLKIGRCVIVAWSSHGHWVWPMCGRPVIFARSSRDRRVVALGGLSLASSIRCHIGYFLVSILK